MRDGRASLLKRIGSRVRTENCIRRDQYYVPLIWMSVLFRMSLYFRHRIAVLSEDIHQINSPFRGITR